jgi:hypothetical protein
MKKKIRVFEIAMVSLCVFVVCGPPNPRLLFFEPNFTKVVVNLMTRTDTRNATCRWKKVYLMEWLSI